MRYCRSGVVYWAHLKPYISANMFANRPSKQAYLYPIRWNVSGEIVSSHLAGCFFASGYKALGRACEHGAWRHSVFTECFQASWISQRKLWDRQLVRSFGGSDHDDNDCYSESGNAGLRRCPPAVHSFRNLVRFSEQ